MFNTSESSLGVAVTRKKIISENNFGEDALGDEFGPPITQEERREIRILRRYQELLDSGRENVFWKSMRKIQDRVGMEHTYDSAKQIYVEWQSTQRATDNYVQA